MTSKPCEACGLGDVAEYVNGRDEKIFACRKCYHIVHTGEKKTQTFEFWINIYDGTHPDIEVSRNLANHVAEPHRLGEAERVVITREVEDAN